MAAITQLQHGELSPEQISLPPQPLTQELPLLAMPVSPFCHRCGLTAFLPGSPPGTGCHYQGKTVALSAQQMQLCFPLKNWEEKVTKERRWFMNLREV